MCLMLQTTEKYSRHLSPLSAWKSGAMEKEWQKRPPDRQLQDAGRKDSDRAKTPVAEAVRVPAHLAPPGYLKVMKLHHLHAQLSLGQSCHRPKQVLCLCAHGYFGSFRFFVTLWTVACQASLSRRGLLQARILVRIGPYWLTYPSGALHFLLP